MDDSDAYRPAFFEVYAAEHLSTALRPALRFVLEVLSVRYPRIVRLASWSDEIFTSLLLILETSQLRKDSALLAESFYSLRRSAVLSFHEQSISASPLSSRKIFYSVLLSVVLPHVKAKLDEWYSNATGGAASELFDSELLLNTSTLDDHDSSGSEGESALTSDQRPRSSSPLSMSLSCCLRVLREVLHNANRLLRGPAMRRLALRLYPRVASVSEGINLMYNVLYLFGHTKHFTLSLALQGLVLRRATTTELLQSVSRKTSVAAEGNTSFDISRAVSVGSERLLAVFKASFFASVFAFRFLQYYYAAESTLPRENGPLLPPPDHLQPAPGIDRKISLSPGLCPLCHKPRVSPTACVASGYVFCYLCILQHVQQTQKCPVTLAPALIEDLVRVYDDTSHG